MPFEPVGQNRIHPRFPIRSRRAKPSDHVCRSVDRNPLFDRALLGGCAPATDQRVAIIFICLFKEIIRQFWRIVGVNPLGARIFFCSRSFAFLIEMMRYAVPRGTHTTMTIRLSSLPTVINRCSVYLFCIL